MTVVFYISAVVALIATVLVITRRNAVHALLYLVVSLLSVSLVFYALGAPFVAALEVIVYAGAIMVLFVFVMMMLNLGEESTRQEGAWLKPRMYVGPALLAAVLLIELFYMLKSGYVRPINGGVVGPQAVGVSLFSTYLLGVELAGMLLLAGLVGAFHLGRRYDTGAKPQTARNVAGSGSKIPAGRR